MKLTFLRNNTPLHCLDIGLLFFVYFVVFIVALRDCELQNRFAAYNNIHKQLDYVYILSRILHL